MTGYHEWRDADIDYLVFRWITPANKVTYWVRQSGLASGDGLHKNYALPLCWEMA